MKKFEYKVITKYHGLSEDELNAYGLAGWEVCGYNHSGVSGDDTYILKKEIISTDILK